jgi:hypothetical protein
MRRMLFVVATLASWFVLLAWAADIEWRAPWSPAIARHWPGNEFRAVFGSAAAAADRLHVGAAAADFSALQSTSAAGVDAADFPTLRYAFRDFPRTLELSLVFRTAEEPDDVQTVSLPWPGDGEATFDLGGLEAWRGTITEIGFEEFATPQVVPRDAGFRPFDVLEVQLWSPSWRGQFAALATDWFGAWPWSQRSVHALGREGEAPRTRSIEIVAAAGIVVVVAWAALLLGWRRRRLLSCLAISAAVAWIGLDLSWQVGLAQRLLATRALYADVAPEKRGHLIGDSDILDAADEVKALLRDEPPQTRILVQAQGSYVWLRLMWHLLPLNVGAYWFVVPYRDSLPDGCLLVFFDNDIWSRDPATRGWLRSSQRITSADGLHANGFDDSRVAVFRYHHAH